MLSMLGKHNTSKTSGTRRSQIISLFLKGLALWAMFGALVNPYVAAASLGGTADTVEADRAHMQASLRMTKKDLYATHELRAPNNVVVREFVSPTGIVFGVAWEGPVRPDLRQVLGGYFSHFTEAAQAQKQRQAGRQPISVTEPGLVVQSGGHPRAFSGRAYLPEMLPVGVHAEEIR